MLYHVTRFDQWRAREKHLTSYLTTSHYIAIKFWQTKTKTNKMADHEINHDERFLFLTWWFDCPSNRKVEEWAMEQFWKKNKRLQQFVSAYHVLESTVIVPQLSYCFRPTFNTQCSQMMAPLKLYCRVDFAVCRSKQLKYLTTNLFS